jgi:hypothetical protein
VLPFTLPKYIGFADPIWVALGALFTAIRSLLFSDAFTRWYSIKKFTCPGVSLFKESSVTPAAAKASLVGANHVNGPGPVLNDSSPALSKVFENMLNCGLAVMKASNVGPLTVVASLFLSQLIKQVIVRQINTYL